MRLAREFRRADWRRMLSEMSATELGEWGDYFRMQSFSDVWMDAQFASLKALIVRMVSGSSDAAVADFSLLPEENGITGSPLPWAGMCIFSSARTAWG